MKSKKIDFDPRRKSITKWNYVVFLACTSSLSLDFFFMYVHTIAGSGDPPGYLTMDWQLGARIAFARSVVDLIVLSDMILIYRSVYTCPKYEPLQRQEVVYKPWYLALYDNSSLIIDLLALVPLPQIVVWCELAGMDGMFFVVVPQFAFKVMALSPYSQRNVKIRGVAVKNAWLGALQNLFYFIMISNGAGALYYDMYIAKLGRCRFLVHNEVPNSSTLTWDELIAQCTGTLHFEFGLFTDALITKLATRSFIQKYTYCLSWGLKSLSSFGQIINANSDLIETILSFTTVVFGLILFGDLLARMQSGLQCTEQKEDRQRARQRMVDEWMKYHQLPQNLKNHVKQVIQSEWSATRGVNEEVILGSLPWDVRSEVRRHLYMEILRSMPLFREMDDHLASAMCGYLRTFSVNRDTYVTFAGEPVHRMLFIVSGQLEVSNADGGQCTILGPGDLCGRELLEWCSHPVTSTEKLQPATQTIKCNTDVDAFALQVDEVKLLAIQFHRDGKFRRAFQRYIA